MNNDKTEIKRYDAKLKGGDKYLKVSLDTDVCELENKLVELINVKNQQHIKILRLKRIVDDLLEFLESIQENEGFEDYNVSELFEETRILIEKTKATLSK